MNELFIIIVILLVLLCIVSYKLYNGYGSAYVKTEIYFGRNMTNGTSVSYDDFNSFLNDIITPLFPMGLTVHNTYGQMFDGQKIEKEKSFVVVLVHKSTLLNNENVNKIINLYRTQFKTTQVMQTRYAIDANFYQRFN